MAITFEGAAGTQGLVGAEPAGVLEGDVLIATTANDIAAVGGPSGWTQIGTTLQGGQFDTVRQVWSIVRGASAPDLTWTGDDNFASVLVHAIRGAVGVSVVGSSADASDVAPSVNNPDDNALLLALYVDSNGNGNVVDAPVGMTDVVPTGATTGSAAAYEIVAAGATGARTFLNTPSPSGAWSVVLEPVPDLVSEGTASGTFAFAGSVSGTNLAAPTGLTATPVADDQIDLSWNAVTGATGYDIERDGVVIVTNHGSTSFSDTGLTADTEYDYRVRARAA